MPRKWFDTDLNYEIWPLFEKYKIVEKYAYIIPAGKPCSCGFASKDCKGKWFIFLAENEKKRAIEVSKFIMYTKAKEADIEYFGFKYPLRKVGPRLQVRHRRSPSKKGDTMEDKQFQFARVKRGRRKRVTPILWK